METKQAVPSASASMESSFEMRLVALGMLDEIKDEVDTWMTQKIRGVRQSSGQCLCQNLETSKFY